MGPLIVESSFPLHPCLGSVLGIAGMGTRGKTRRLHPVDPSFLLPARSRVKMTGRNQRRRKASGCNNRFSCGAAYPLEKL